MRGTHFEPAEGAWPRPAVIDSVAYGGGGVTRRLSMRVATPIGSRKHAFHSLASYKARGRPGALYRGMLFPNWQLYEGPLQSEILSPI